MACRAALAVTQTIQSERLVEQAERRGELLKEALRETLGGLNCVVDVRGKGMMVGVELDRPCAELVQRAMERRLLINVTAERVVRLLPPLIMDDEQINDLAARVSDIIRDWNSGS